MTANKLNTMQLLLTGQSSDHIVWLSERIGIHRRMLKAWMKMQFAAKGAGFDLQIASGFRSFERQLIIWNNKYSGKTPVKDRNNIPLDLNQQNKIERINAILAFSALPSASRHHWGTDIDIYAPNLLNYGQSLQLEPWEYQQGGAFYSLLLWLREHCSNYGFYFPYDVDRGGVAIEPWHLSYAPLAYSFQQQLSLTLLNTTIANSDILAKACILENCPYIYKNFIMNVNPPTTTLLENNFE